LEVVCHDLFGPIMLFQQRGVVARIRPVALQVEPE
jgi:hypothetical protein